VVLQPSTVSWMKSVASDETEPLNLCLNPTSQVVLTVSVLVGPHPVAR